MHIYVCIKQTPDSASVYVDPISGHVDVERFVQILNPADACAVEAAVRLKEQSSEPGSSVMVLTLGPEDAEGALRAALALGADRVLRLWHPHLNVQSPFAIAAALAAYIRQAQPAPDLILCGDSSSDWASGTVGPALAAYLDLPQVTGVARLQSSTDENKTVLQVTRKLEHGYRELLEVELPALITVTADLNEPRYPSLPAHIAALRAQIPVLDPHAFPGYDSAQAADETTLIEIHTPRPRPRRIPAPDSKHTAYQRIGEIVAGGATGRQTRLVEGSPEELAEALVTFLKEKGFI